MEKDFDARSTKKGGWISLNKCYTCKNKEELVDHMHPSIGGNLLSWHGSFAKRNKKMLGWPLPCACSGLYGKKKIGSHLKVGSNLKMLNKWTKHWCTLFIGIVNIFHVLPIKKKIVWIPKNGSKEDIKDFRPINLIGGFYKFLVKILANRLKKVIGKVSSES